MERTQERSRYRSATTRFWDWCVSAFYRPQAGPFFIVTMTVNSREAVESMGYVVSTCSSMCSLWCLRDNRPR